jgi:hypothetical protein
MKLVGQLFGKTRTIRNSRPTAKVIGNLLRLEDRITPTNMNLNSHFLGLHFSQTQGYVPPDTCGAAGTSQYVETVNQTVEIFNKSNGSSLALANLDTFLFTTGGLTHADGGSGLSDPIVVWDEQIQRFIIGDQDVNFSSHVSAFDIAVSKSGTPTTLGTSDWAFYKVTTTESGFDADYPGNFGWNHDAFVFTLNMFPASSGFAKVQIVSVNIQDLANAVSQANLHSFHNDDSNDFSLRPAVMHDSIANDPEWFVADNGDGSTIDVVKMSNVLSNSATFTTTVLSVTPFTEISPPTGDPRQPNGSATTTNIDSRIMKAAEAGGMLVASQAVTTGTSDRDLAQWYEINVSSGTPVMFQEGDVTGGTGNAGSANVYDVYPSIDINPDGDLGMTYMESSHTGTNAGEFVSVWVTGWAPGDTLGAMETPILVQAGAQNYTDFANPHRQGDLSGINVDSDGSFWIANEYANTDGSANWGTAIGNFSVNAAPVLANIEGSNLVFGVGGSPINITQTLTVSDPDNTKLTGATVQITSNYVSTEDVLGFTNQNGITGSFNSGTGKLTLSGTATLAQYQTALQSVTYQDTNAVNPSTSTRTVTFQVNDGQSFNNLSNTQTRNIRVVIHSSPVLANIEASPLAYTAGQVATAITQSLTATDSDSSTLVGATVSITSNFVSSEDVLAFTNTANITGSYNSTTGVLTLSGTDTVANYQTALHNVTYSDSSLLPTASTRTVTFQVDDGFSVNNLSNTETRNINVTQHVAPVLSNIEGTTLAYTAGQAATAITGQLTVTDSDSATIKSATVSITSGLVAAEDVLAFTNTANITGSYNSATGVLTLTGADTLANYQAALHSVTYSDSNLLPSAGTRTVTFQVDDGFANHNLSNTQARNISVTRHVAPVLANIEGSTIAYTAGQPATIITSQMTVADSDSTTIKSATVSITSGLVKAEDVLAFANLGNITGSYNSSTGVLTLTGVDTVANYQAALQTVTYRDSNLLPSAGTRTVTFQVNDGFANNNLSNTQARNISVTQHVAPVLANIEGTTISYVTGQGPVNITSSITVSDVDSATISSAKVSITSGFSSSQDVLSFTNFANITGSYNSSNGVLTLTGVDSLANYQAALQSVTYTDNSASPSTSTRTVTFQVDDGFANNHLSNTQTRNISVSAHPAPVLAGIETTSLAFGAGQAATPITNTLTLADSVSISGATVAITTGYHSAEDVLAFTNQNGITGSFNSATGVMTLSGTASVANYQAALRSVTYQDTNVAPATTTRTVTFQVTDVWPNNNVSNTKSRNITVSAHVPPSLANIETTTLAYQAGQGPLAITGTLTVSDPDSTTISSATVAITTNFASAEDSLAFTNTPNITGSYNPATGVLILSGVDTLAAYQSALRSVAFVDGSATPSLLTRTVSFQVDDGFGANSASNIPTRKISVSAHVAPVLANLESSALQFAAGQSATAVTNTLTVTSAGALQSATVKISAGFVSSEDVLAFTNTATITGSYNSATGVLTLTGADTAANYQAALRSVTYRDANLLPTPSTRTVTFQVDDGFSVNHLSNTPSRNINVTDHVAPVLANIEAAALSFNAGQSATAITGSLTVTDVDSTTIAGATVAITSGFVSGEDVLGFTNQNGITGSYNSGTGLLTLSGTATLAQYQAALRSVTYFDGNVSPTVGARTVTFSVNDGFANNNISNNQSRTINVGAHVAPVLANIESSVLSYLAKQAATPITGSLTVTDSDSATIASATVSITSGFVSGEDVLGFTNQNGITGSYNAATGVLMLSGAATVAQYQAALRSVTYVDSNANPTVGTRTVAFQVNDGFANNNLSDTQSRNISVSLPSKGLLVVSGNNNPVVKVYDAVSHQLKYTLNPFGAGFVNGMHVATGDVNGDGTPDIFIAEGQVGFPVVAIYDGANGQLIRKLQAFDNTYRSGAYVSLADLNGDGKADLVVSRGQGGSGTVAVYSGADLINNAIVNPTPIWQFTPYGTTFLGGVSVAAFTNNGTGFIATAPVVGMQSWVQVYNFNTKVQTARFLAYNSGYTQGMTVVAGDVNGDGIADIVTAPNQSSAKSILNGGGLVEVFGGDATATTFMLTQTITPYTTTPSAGIHITLDDVNKDGVLDIITAPGSTTNNVSPPIKAFDGTTGADLTSWDWTNTDFLGGVFIG